MAIIPNGESAVAKEQQESSSSSSSSSSDTTYALANVAVALGITSQDWSELGLGDDPNVAASNDLGVTVDRLTALLLIRIIAWIQPPETYKNLSTSTICRTVLSDRSWPKALTRQVMDELKRYVSVILKGYEDVPYHNFEHCYHVSISVNKLLDMILEPLDNDDNNNTTTTELPNHSAHSNVEQQKQKQEQPETYGFKDDPLMQFALLFAALAHDVQHKGIPNRQLANENDHLAVLYNDTSIAEQNSLYLSFSELLKDEYKTLRSTVFPEKEDYRRFRKAVVNLVLCTDIACPDRSQLYKSKWKEAFGDPYETVERKVRRAMKKKGRRNSLGSVNRRLSTSSILSELTSDSPRVANREIDVLQDDSSVSLSPDETSSDDDDDDVADAEEILAKSKIKRGSKKKIKSNNNKDQMNGGENIKEPDYYLELGGSGSNSDHDGQNDSPRKIPSKAATQYQNYNVPLSGGDDQHQQSPRGRRHLSGRAMKFHRRLTNEGGASSSKPRYRTTRLGLLRTVDLTGEKIQAFNSSRRASVGALPTRSNHTNNSNDSKANKKGAVLSEEASELRETVIMETILLASDVAHNLQGWDQMAKWSNRLFLELRKAHVQGRGADPTDGWYPNQIGFLEAYLLPLARRLDDTGVFGDERGSIFAEIVEENRERWTREGVSLTANIISKGMRIFPDEHSHSEAETEL